MGELVVLIKPPGIIAIKAQMILVHGSVKKKQTGTQDTILKWDSIMQTKRKRFAGISCKHR